MPALHAGGGQRSGDESSVESLSHQSTPPDQAEERLVLAYGRASHCTAHLSTPVGGVLLLTGSASWLIGTWQAFQAQSEKDRLQE